MNYSNTDFGNKSNRRRVAGQGLTEYIIIVALIAIAAITVVSLFGETVQAQFAGMASTLAGDTQTAGDSITAAQDAGKDANQEIGAKTLGTYAN